VHPGSVVPIREKLKVEQWVDCEEREILPPEYTQAGENQRKEVPELLEKAGASQTGPK